MKFQRDNYLHNVTLVISAPICSPPPAIPTDGFLNISHPVHDVQNIHSCMTDGKNLSISCPSFLNIYIRSAIYVIKAKVLGPEEDCLDTDVIKMIRSKCHGRYSCVLSVSDGLADLSLDCSTNKKELSITHTCGKNT